MSAMPVGALHHDLREAVRALDEVAVLVGGQQRHVVDVVVGQVDAEEVARLRLDELPGRHAADFGVGIAPVPKWPSAPRFMLVISLPVATG